MFYNMYVYYFKIRRDCNDGPACCLCVEKSYRKFLILYEFKKLSLNKFRVKNKTTKKKNSTKSTIIQ